MADPSTEQEVEIAKLEAKKLIDSKPKSIKTKEQADAAWKLIREISRVRANIIEKRKGVTRPLQLAINEAKELFSGPENELKEAAADIQKKIQAFTKPSEK